jgi:hypothetical protein
MGRLLRPSNCIGYLLVLLALCCGEFCVFVHSLVSTFSNAVCTRYDMIGDVMVLYAHVFT